MIARDRSRPVRDPPVVSDVSSVRAPSRTRRRDRIARELEIRLRDTLAVRPRRGRLVVRARAPRGVAPGPSVGGRCGIVRGIFLSRARRASKTVPDASKSRVLVVSSPRWLRRARTSVERARGKEFSRAGTPRAGTRVDAPERAFVRRGGGLRRARERALTIGRFDTFAFTGFDSRRRSFRRSTTNRSVDTNVARALCERVRSDFERRLPFLFRDRGGRLSRFRGVVRVTNQWCATSFISYGVEVISRRQRICLPTRWRFGRRARLAHSDNHSMVRREIRLARTELCVSFARKPAMHPAPT